MGQASNYVLPRTDTATATNAAAAELKSAGRGIQLTVPNGLNVLKNVTILDEYLNYFHPFNFDCYCFLDKSSI